jgi:hypothetical protein
MNWENFLMIFSTSPSEENSRASGLSFRVILVPLSKERPSASETSYSPYTKSIRGQNYTYRAITDPSDSLLSLRLREHLHAVSNNETGVESNTELPDD